MVTYTLTFLDTVGIQEYLFGSNVLRENIGASELVHRATRLWPFQVLREQGGQTNLWPDVELTGNLEDLNGSLTIEDGDLDAEVLYAGGGNCAVLFAKREKAIEFVTELSRRAVAGAPGLELVAVHVPVEWDDARGDALSAKMREAGKQMVTKKLARGTSMPLLGLGVTAACQSTGLPAVGTDDAPNLKPDLAPARPLSAGILAKLQSRKAASQRLTSLVPEIAQRGFDIPYDFDHFGREVGEISYIAVVHADANAMGKRLEALGRAYDGPAKNRAYVEALRDFSAAVEEAAQQALRDTVHALLDLWRAEHWAMVSQVPVADAGEQRTIEVGMVRLAEGEEGQPYVPFRPIVFGGDDLTFVTDGRLGLPLAAAYLEFFEQAAGVQAAAQENQVVRGLLDLKACAGVSVVKTHYPFARAYDLADGLCANAKEARNCQYPSRECSALDWHFAATGLFGTVDEIRERHYEVLFADAEGKTAPAHLEMRPVSLHHRPGDWRSWPAFAGAVTAFLTAREWRGRRNKVIALRQALRDGETAVRRFLAANEPHRLPFMAEGVDALPTSGWDGADRCGYFDAVEALDFFFPLGGGGGKEAN